MDQGSEFERLEQYVNKLIVQFDKLHEENSRLRDTLEQQQSKIESLEKEINSADSERGDISNRIKGLIDRIEEWESALPGTDIGPEQSEETNSIDEPEEQNTQEKNQQQNLFNVQPRSTEHEV